VSALILSLKLPATSALTLSEQLPRGRLIEITRAKAGAQITTAVTCLRAAQAAGQPAAWIQPAGGSLFPPDLAQSGIDLDALLIVNVPMRAGAHGLAKAAELLLRSGGFGMVVLDLCGVALRDTVWQGRLLGLAREHDSWLLLLSDAGPAGAPPRNHSRSHTRSIEPTDRAAAASSGQARSLGPLVSLCLEPHRQRVRRGVFAIEQRVRKDKSGLLSPLVTECRRGPWGLL
jgi:recombination protein RecA